MMIKKKLYLFASVCFFVFAFNLGFAEPKHTSKDTSKVAEKVLYQQYPASADGIGKVYLGREIAQVMSYQGAAWLERETREKEERTDILLRALNLKKGMIVADIGVVQVIYHAAWPIVLACKALSMRWMCKLK